MGMWFKALVTHSMTAGKSIFGKLFKQMRKNCEIYIKILIFPPFKMTVQWDGLVHK